MPLLCGGIGLSCLSKDAESWTRILNRAVSHSNVTAGTDLHDDNVRTSPHVSFFLHLSYPYHSTSPHTIT